jgi:hypothetical protein
LQAEALFQLDVEGEIVAFEQALGVFRRFRPDDGGAVAFQRQDGEGAGRQEMFLGAALMRALMGDGGDDAHLAVIPMHRLDAGERAQVGFRAVGGDQQPGLHG